MEDQVAKRFETPRTLNSAYSANASRIYIDKAGNLIDVWLSDVRDKVAGSKFSYRKCV